MAMQTVLLKPASSARHKGRYARLALSAYLGVLVLIGMGSIVRVSGNGLGCPDWPLCYGQVVPPLLLSPWVEFTHRLIGAAVAAQIIALAVWAWRYRQERVVLYLSSAAVGLTLAQAALGGLHVLLELLPQTGWIHTGVAMAIAALLAALAAWTNPSAREWSAHVARLEHIRNLAPMLALGAGVTYFLILTGAYVTRSGAALVCPSFPLCGGEESAVALQPLMDIQMFHRFTAFATVLISAVILWRLWQVSASIKPLRLAALILACLLILQFALGISNILLRLPMWSSILHLVVAALIWTGWIMLVTIILGARRGDNRLPS